jgi:uncharacterized protein YbaP (TraB family)
MKWIQRIAAVVLMMGALLLAVGRAQAEPAMWVVKGPHATVYLLGSIHVLKKDDPWRSAKIDAAIKASGSLWLEITDVDDPKALQPLMLQLGVDAAHPLSQQLTKEQVAKLDTVATEAGIPGGEAGMEPLRPWLAALMLSAAPMAKAGFDPQSGVELILKPEFVAAGKPVHGFETADQQFHFFADLPEKTQVDYLNSTVDEFDTAADKFKKLVAAWYAGDTKGLDDLMSKDFREKYPDLYQTLIVKRNQSFVGQIDGLLKGDGTSFVAVGAAHLVGNDGVVEMLQKLGYKVERQ